MGSDYFKSRRASGSSFKARIKMGKIFAVQFIPDHGDLLEGREDVVTIIQGYGKWNRFSAFDLSEKHIDRLRRS